MRPPPTRSWKSSPAISVNDSLVGNDPTPPAAVSLLLAADALPVQVGAMLYASPGLACEANVSGLSVRRIGVVVPVACKYSRLWVTRCGSVAPLQPIVQADHKHASATGGGYTGNSVSVASSSSSGSEVYLQTSTTPMTGVEITPTGTTINDAPTAQIDRALLTPLRLFPSVEVYEVQQVCGIAVQFWSRAADLELL